MLAPAEVGAAWKLAHIMEKLAKALTAHRRPDGVKPVDAELGMACAVVQVLSGPSSLLG